MVKLQLHFAHCLRDNFYLGPLLNRRGKWGGGLDGAVLCVVQRPLLLEVGPSGHSSTRNLLFPLWQKPCL